MAHPRTPPRQTTSSASIRTRSFGLVSPSTPRHHITSSPTQCPDAPFLPSNMFSLPVRTSPRSRKLGGTPTREPVRVRSQQSTILVQGVPPTPAETPVQKRKQEEEMLRRVGNDVQTTNRRLFPSSTAKENVFGIYTDM